MANRTCVVVENGVRCTQPHKGHGYCHKHHERFRKHGDPSVVKRTRGNRDRKYSVDCEYFDQVDTPEKAYWLGFITADGGVVQTRTSVSVNLELHEVNAGHLLKFARALGSDAPIVATKQSCVRIRLNSRRLADGLGALGVVQRKSLIVEPPLETLSGLEPYYWRGLWDGDGGVHTRKGRCSKWTISICGSLACVDGFASWARQVSGSTARPGNKNSRNPAFWRWDVTGTRKPQLLAEQLRLAGPGFGLDRKQVLLEAVCAFDLDEREALANSRRSASVRDAWATGRHARARRAV